MTRRALCFDATGTLIETRETVGAVYSEIANEFGVHLPGWRLDDAFKRVMRHAPPRGVADRPRTLEERQQAEFDWWSERIRQTFQASDSTVRFDDFPSFARALFDAYRSPSRWRVRMRVGETLATLSELGFEMVVVSNFDYRLIEILEKLELSIFFKGIFIPSNIETRKPDRAVFERVAAQLEIPRTNLIYIGDDPPEILAEIRAHGLHVIDIGGLSDFHALTEEFATPAMVSPESAGTSTSNP